MSLGSTIYHGGARKGQYGAEHVTALAFTPTLAIVHDSLSDGIIVLFLFSFFSRGLTHTKFLFICTDKCTHNWFHLRFWCGINVHTQHLLSGFENAFFCAFTTATVR